ncbi:hypothetical protein PTKIN_Ptkin05aG0007000 [Pterospermum kingtungense]
MEQWKDQLEQLKIQLEPWKKQLEPWKDQLEQWLHQAIEYLNQIPPIQLYAAIAVLFISTLLLLSIRLFKRTKTNTILLTGLSGSGKTVLFYQLRDGSSHQGTVTSMEPNEGTFVLNSESNKFLPQAAGIVFVVDSLEFLPNLHLVAEYLYDILTKASVVKKKIPLLICCNKSDKVTAHSKDFIKKQLEKQIDKLRASRTAISAADISSDFTLGVPGEAFTFSQCRNKVTVAEASGLTGEVAQVEQFIREHVKS